MKQAGFYFSEYDDDATSFCPECGELNTSTNVLSVLGCVKINRPVYVQCDHCETLYNIGGTGEEEE